MHDQRNSILLGKGPCPDRIFYTEQRCVYFDHRDCYRDRMYQASHVRRRGYDLDYDNVFFDIRIANCNLHRSTYCAPVPGEDRRYFLLRASLQEREPDALEKRWHKSED